MLPDQQKTAQACPSVQGRQLAPQVRLEPPVVSAAPPGRQASAARPAPAAVQVDGPSSAKQFRNACPSPVWWVVWQAPLAQQASPSQHLAELPLPQASWPVAQQVPEVQVWPLPQETVQLPQWASSAWRSAQVPGLEAVAPQMVEAAAGQPQTPAAQAPPIGQARHLAPQAVASVRSSTQRPGLEAEASQTSGLAAGQLQLPVVQLAPVGQAVAQVPQCLASAWRS